MLFLKLTYRIICLLVVAAMVACSGNDNDAPKLAGNDAPGTFLQITLGQSALSRSNPSGGEDGDGLEPGINHENDIRTLALFIYNDPAASGLNCAPATPFVAKYFLSEADLSQADKVTDTYNPNAITYTFKVEPFDISSTLRVAIVANVPDITKTITTLGQLRTHIVNQSVQLSQQISASDRFVMANAYAIDGAIEIPTAPNSNEVGTEQYPLRGHVSLERLSARIDLITDNIASAQHNVVTNNGKYTAGHGFHDINTVVNGMSVIRYPVVEQQNISGTASRHTAEVWVTHILPVNVMQQPSFAMKHVTNDASVPTDITTLNVCGNEYMGVNGRPTNYVVDPRTVSKAGLASVPTDWYGSTAAGTINAASFTTDNSVHAMAAACWHTAACSDVPNTQFSIMTYANENTQHMDVIDTNILTGVVIRALYVPTTVFNNAAATTQVAYSPGSDLWRVVPHKNSGSSLSTTISDADCLYFNNQYAAATYSTDNPDLRATVEFIPNGTCYYNTWIRHARVNDTDNPARYPMEYGIVRNNIYRLMFTFHGPGSQTIINRTPEYLQSEIYVRKWVFNRVPTIIM